MSGPKRNPDSLNTIGVVVVGICGAVMVYVSITALQAFYMNDTSELQTMQDYGGQDTVREVAQGRGDAEHQRAADRHAVDHDRQARWTSSIRDAVEVSRPARPGRADRCEPGFVPKATEVAHRRSAGAARHGAAAGAGRRDRWLGRGPNGLGLGLGGTPAAAGSGGAGSTDSGANIHLHSTGSPADRGRQPVGGAGGAPVGVRHGQWLGRRLAPGGHAQ